MFSIYHVHIWRGILRTCFLVLNFPWIMIIMINIIWVLIVQLYKRMNNLSQQIFCFSVSSCYPTHSAKKRKHHLFKTSYIGHCNWSVETYIAFCLSINVRVGCKINWYSSVYSYDSIALCVFFCWLKLKHFLFLWMT